MPKTLRTLLSAFLLLAGLGASAWHRLHLPDASRALELDEMISMTQSTWVGLEPNGEMRPVRSVHVMHATPASAPAQVALGFYQAVGRWQEPNNHILNSLGMNASFWLFGTTEQSSRIASTLGAVVFALAVFWLCVLLSDSPLLAFLAATVAWSIPYAFRFSLTARGYSWMMALAVMHLVAAHYACRSPRAVSRHALMAVIGVGSVINIVSMATDWLLPVYATMFVAGAGQTDRSRDHMRAWRRGLVAQGAAICVVLGAFFLAHLPSVASAAGQYGIFVDSPSALVTAVRDAVGYLFDGPGWSTMPWLGIAGFAAALTSARLRWVGLTGLTVIALNLLNYGLTGRLPYERAMGHWVVLGIVGTAVLVAVIHQSATSMLTRRLLLAAATGLGIVLVSTTAQPALAHPALASMVDVATRTDEPAAGRVTLVPNYTDDDFAIEFNAPASRQTVQQLVPDVGVRLLYFSTPRGLGRVPILKEHVGRTYAIDADVVITPGSFVTWYFDVGNMGLSFAKQFGYLDERKVTYWQQYQRVRLKFNVFGINNGAMMSVDDSTSLAATRELVLEGMRRFGGRGVIFVADRVSEHPVP